MSSVSHVATEDEGQPSTSQGKYNTCVHGHVCVCGMYSGNVSMCVHVCMHVHTLMCVHVCACMHACAYVNVCLCVCLKCPSAHVVTLCVR